MRGSTAGRNTGKSENAARNRGVVKRQSRINQHASYGGPQTDELVADNQVAGWMEKAAKETCADQVC